PQDPNFLKISIACGKVEQFIESIFPTQKLEDAIAKAKGQETSRDKAVAEAQAKQSEATGDTVWVLVAVFVVVAVISGTMLGLAWLGGARFDLAFNDATAQLKQLWGFMRHPDGPATLKSKTPQVAKSEL
ncbi:MAG: bifunctional farnesyl-diphosphate farnesyltransferase/squalene synthase, partial [Watsoniomyces obsoletus]